VNNTHNSILIDEEYNILRDSIDSFDRYDPMALAKKLKHPILEFRRIQGLAVSNGLGVRLLTRM
jgi:clathrin heavy chain